MPNINVGLSIQVEGELQVPVAPIKINVEAYDKLEKSIASGSTGVSIDVQPGDKTVSFLLIKSSVYTPSDAKNDEQLTYQTGDKTINLDKPQIFLGIESIQALLGSVQKIEFSNKLVGDAAKDPAVVEILVGRNATTPAT